MDEWTVVDADCWVTYCTIDCENWDYRASYDLKECLEISGATSLQLYCHLQLCEMLVMAWDLKQQQSSSSLPFPKPRRWLRGPGGMCLKSWVRERVVHSCSASCVWCNLTTHASENVMYGCPCGHFQELAAGLPFSLHQQLGKHTSGHILMLFLCHHYSMKLLKVHYCAEWSCNCFPRPSSCHRIYIATLKHQTVWCSVSYLLK